jgi:hypothetical protein
LIGPRILELHDLRDGRVVRVRWYEVSADGDTVIATTNPSSRPLTYRRQREVSPGAVTPLP